MKEARPFGLAFVASAMRTGAMLAFACLGGTAWAQRVPALTIAPRNASIDDGFTSLWSLRELSDGRVLFTDGLENRLYLADFSAGALRTIGRPGRGPGEVQFYNRIFPMPGDSTLVVDDGNGARWVVYHGDKPARTFRPDHPLIEATREPRGRLVGAALDGSLLLLSHDRSVREEYRNGYRQLDSGKVMRVAAGRTRGELLMRVQGTDQRVQVAPMQNGRPFYAFNQATLSTSDRATMAPDGWVAIATQRPYRVTWFSPDGRKVEGPDLGWPHLPVTEAEKLAYVRRTQGPQATLANTNPNGWVDAIPPFGGLFGASHAPDGRLFLRKVPTAADPRTRYDVIDRSGRIVAELVLPANEYLAGFGARSVYKVVKDEDDLLHLQRHPWP